MHVPLGAVPAAPATLSIPGTTAAPETTAAEAAAVTTETTAAAEAPATPAPTAAAEAPAVPAPTAAAEAAPDAAPAETHTTTPAPTPTAEAPEARREDDLPDNVDDLKKMVRKLRNENGKSRTEAKTKAAEDATATVVNKIGRALGLITDTDTSPTPTVDELTQRLTESETQRQNERIQFAVYKAASGIADPDALIDSKAFTHTLSALNPDDTAAIQNAITAFVQANPRFALSQVARANSVDHAAGSGENDITLEQFRGMTLEKRNELYKRDKATYDRLASAL